MGRVKLGPDTITINGAVVLTDQVGGRTFYVGNTADVGRNPSDGNPGTLDRPFSTLNHAIGKCLANRGDVIYVLPGHVENIGDTSTSGAIDLDVAGISVIGIGNGSLQPRFDFDDADSDFLVGANNILIENINLHADAPDVLLGVAIEAAVTNTTIRGCKFDVETAGTDEFAETVHLLAGCDYTVVDNCLIDMDLGNATNGVKLTGASYGVTVKNNTIKGDYSVACISSDTTLSEETMIDGNMLIQGQTGALNAVAVLDMVTGNTGIIRDNYIVCDVATHLLMADADAMSWFNNLATSTVGRAITAEYFSATVVADADGN